MRRLQSQIWYVFVDITISLSAVPSPTQIIYTPRPMYNHLTCVSGLWVDAPEEKLHRENMKLSHRKFPAGQEVGGEGANHQIKYIKSGCRKKRGLSSNSWNSWEDLILTTELIPQQTESLETGSLALRRPSFSFFSRCFSSFSWAFFMSFSFFLMVERSLWLETPSAWRKNVWDFVKTQTTVHKPNDKKKKHFSHKKGSNWSGPTKAAFTEVKATFVYFLTPPPSLYLFKSSFKDVFVLPSTCRCLSSGAAGRRRP